MATLKHLIEEKNIRADVTYGAEYNENFPNSDGWTVTLKCQRRQMTVPFYTGMGSTNDPDAEMVLECLLSDASVEYNRSFEDWAGDLGYDTDSRKAEKIYKACLKIAKKLHALLGDDFDTFMEAEH